MKKIRHSKPLMGLTTALRALLILAAVFAFCGPAAAEGALVFDKAEYAARRAKLMEKIGDGTAVFLGAKPLTGYFPFSQANDFLYLTGVEAPNAALVIDGAAKRSVLFLTLTEREARNDGISLDLVRDPRAATGIDMVMGAELLPVFLTRLASRAKVLYTPVMPEELARECSSEKLGLLQRSMTLDPWDGRLTREQTFVRHLRDRCPGIEIKDASEPVWALRMKKSPAEVDLMRKAGRIGVKAHIELMKATKPGMSEYELAALFEYVCKKEGAEDLAYYTIICSGENHPYVHYYKYDRVLKDGDFLVIDGGPRLKGYGIDITISYPANGKFTPRQKEVYEAAAAVHEANLSLYKPGLTAEEVRAQVAEILKAKGFDLSRDVFKMVAGGFGHYVGMAVHDVGGGPRVLEPGMVFANEPLAIFPAENLGVRVEDTVYISETGMENLTPGIPRTVAEIEALMKSGRK